MSDLLVKPVKQHATLFTFEWDRKVRWPGALFNQTRRYTDWTENITVGGNLFTHLNGLHADRLRNSGGVNDREVVVFMPAAAEPANTLVSEFSHPRTIITIQEVKIDAADQSIGDLATLRGLRKVQVARAGINVRGRKALAVLTCSGQKIQLHATLGIPAFKQCAWHLGDKGCQVELDAGNAGRREVGTITDITDNVITVSGLTTTATAAYWEFGFVEKEGHEIGIRRYSTGTTMELIRPPPAAWEGTSAYFYPGCDGELMTCKNKFDNVKNFCGLGYRMPERHPLIEYAGNQADAP